MGTRWRRMTRKIGNGNEDTEGEGKTMQGVWKMETNITGK